MSTLHWPCPNNCMTWCRRHGEKTNHHPHCEYVNESLIDVWRVTLPDDEPNKGGCLFDQEEHAKSFANDNSEPDEPPLQISKEEMHREIFENLNEFAGF